jgi:hypothetical protein
MSTPGISGPQGGVGGLVRGAADAQRVRLRWRSKEAA